METIPNLRTLGAAVLLTALAGAASAEEPSGVVGGRLVIMDGDDRLTVREAEQALRGEAIAVELRKGSEVYEVALATDGLFFLQAPPGRYRLEYLRVGEKAEFIPPQELSVGEGAVTCAGTLTVDTGYVDNLGANHQSEVKAVDDCAALMPLLQGAAKAMPRTRVALARTGAVLENPRGFSLIDRLGSVSLELGGMGPLAMRVTYTHDLPVRWNPYLAVQLYASVGQVWPYLWSLDQPLGKELLAGVGANVSGWEMVAYGGTRLEDVPIGPVPVAGAFVRLQFGAFGFGFRGELMPFLSWSTFVQVSPVMLIGEAL